MNNKLRDYANLIVAGIIIFGMFLWCVIKTDENISASERRKLSSFPKVTKDNVMGKSGVSYMTAFEKYAADQFPARETFRRINSNFRLKVLRNSEINDLVIKDGYITKLEYDVNEDSIAWSLDRINYIYDTYLCDNNRVYFSIIPDKNYYLLSEDNYPSIDYATFFSEFKNAIKDKMTYIDLTGILNIENYYKTDTHWKQETLFDAAKYVLNQMNMNISSDFVECELDNDFFGVYYGQLAIKANSDKIKYLTGREIEGLKAYCFDSGIAKEISIYDMEKAYGMDPYEMFLSGSNALVTIENSNAKSDNELIVFRDSFGSSLAPLLACGYKKVTLVDIRYINPAMLGRFIDFEGNDVLFLYSVQVLNNSIGQFIN